MPTYTWTCTTCKNNFDKALTFKEYDRVKENGNNQYLVKCPDCAQYFSVTRTYEGAPGIRFGKGFFKDGYESAKNVTRKEE
ncbi:hypothetical protein HN803_03730 [candidate division WWE3 bacterium]|jgi:predicted nucleic acid-binding Zn ribbon protein|nr:hypothetical protein [candidate division WWE3 bacterium]